MFGRLGGGCDLREPGSIQGNKAVQVVAVGTVGTEGFFIEQTLDTATQTDLVGVVLEANWPAHLAVPATP